MSLKELIVMPAGKDRGGAEEALLQYVTYRTSQGAPPHVIVLEPGPLMELLEARGAKVTFIDARRVRDIRRRIQTVRTIAAIARQEREQSIFGSLCQGQLLAG